MLTSALTVAIVINEIMASNAGSVMSPATNFDSWIELYNPTEQPINLSGMYLTDNLENPTKYQITKNAPLSSLISHLSPLISQLLTPSSLLTATSSSGATRATRCRSFMPPSSWQPRATNCSSWQKTSRGPTALPTPRTLPTRPWAAIPTAAVRSA